MTNYAINHATQIGYKICKTAIRQNGHCTWMTKEYHRESQESTFIPMDAEFYKGLSGVAYFLAALYASSPQTIFKETAIGAMRQALSIRKNIKKEHTFSFYRGLSGLLFSLIKIQDFCEVKVFKKEIKEIQNLLENADIEASHIDVIEGLGSGLPSLIQIQKIIPSKQLDKKIRETGNHLVFLAKQRERGVSWQTSSSVSHTDLTGFSHGTAGLASALVKLYDTSTDDRYLTTALKAIDYEIHDLEMRQIDLENKKNIEGIISFDWAHGYAGKALSYLVAYQSTQLDFYKTQAVQALNHCFQYYSKKELSSFDYSITNGVWGATDALIEASNILNEPSFKTQADTLFQKAIAAFEKDGNHWGGHHKITEEVPDFMISLGGIGYSMLRLLDAKKYPSVLCL